MICFQSHPMAINAEKPLEAGLLIIDDVGLAGQPRLSSFSASGYFSHYSPIGGDMVIFETS